MNSGHIRETIMRTYNVTKDQAQGMMDVLEIMSDSYHRAYKEGMSEGYRSSIENYIYLMSPCPNEIDTEREP